MNVLKYPLLATTMWDIGFGYLEQIAISVLQAPTNMQQKIRRQLVLLKLCNFKHVTSKYIVIPEFEMELVGKSLHRGDPNS